VRTQTKPKLHNGQVLGVDDLLQSAAQLLADDLPIAELFSKLAALLSSVFDTALVEIALNGEPPEKYRYGVEFSTSTGTNITLPIVFHAEQLGLLHIRRKTERPFSSDDIHVLETCALFVAVRLNQAELLSAKERSEELAGIDPLTGIASRRDFNTQYQTEWTRGKRQGGLVSVLMIDVDHFKNYNDLYGHVAGDACLHKIAQCLSRCAARAGDTTARYGGEEFAVVLPLTDHDGAIATAERIRSAVLAQRIEHKGSDVGLVTVSIGVATGMPIQSSSSTELLEKADIALYLAKGAGRNAVFGDDYQTDAIHTGQPPIQSNLPTQLTAFFGRAPELDAMEYLFTQTRLLTLTGVAGIGKTRVAQQWARDNLKNYPDGIWFVDLARVTDAALVVGSVMFVLGETEEQGKQPLSTLVDQVGEQTMLIVLDNCQRLIEECALMSEALLRKCANVRIIATCRNRLGIAGEIAYRIPPLPVGDASDLFEARASSINPEFRATAKSRPLIEGIVGRLDGIPMAIELAAARVKIMSVSELDARLEERFPVPATTSRPVKPREEILPVLVDWSYEMLDEEERQLFRRLAIFPGDWNILASEEICSNPTDGKSRGSDVLARLMDKALIWSEPHGSDLRYSMFETLREYGRNLLHEIQEFEDLKHLHASYYCKVAEALDLDRTAGAADFWQQSVELEHHNFGAALEWSVLAAGDLRTGAALATALAAWWAQTRHFREGRYWLDHIIWRANESNISAGLRAKLLSAASLIGSQQADIAPIRQSIT
jgi:diguanylate cyclase (GGDEF)-like protein